LEAVPIAGIRTGPGDFFWTHSGTHSAVDFRRQLGPLLRCERSEQGIQIDHRTRAVRGRRFGGSYTVAQSETRSVDVWQRAQPPMSDVSFLIS